MKHLLKEISIITFVCIMIIALLQFPVNATNDKIEIVKTENEYLIYDEATMKGEFQFAFTKESTEEAPIAFTNSKVDTEGNNVAYVDADFEATYFEVSETGEKIAYMWVKQAEEVSEPILVNLNSAITQEILSFVGAITTKIPVTVGQETKEPVTEENTTITTTVGYLQIQPQEGYTYEYQLVKLPNENYADFVALAKEISNFEENANSYSNISKINKFYSLYNNLIPTENWKEVVDNRIEQPEEARNGEEYVVWLKATNQTGEEILDVQFMTSVREETEERTTETVTEEVTTTTKLPVTFDSNMILIIVLAIIIVAIIVLFVVKKRMSKKHDK